MFSMLEIFFTQIYNLINNYLLNKYQKKFSIIEINKIHYFTNDDNIFIRNLKQEHIENVT